MTIRLLDVRHEMPVRADTPPPAERRGSIDGIAIHHSGTANAVTGLGVETARHLFEHQVNHRGWSRGGYHYVIPANGVVEYALDIRVPAFHAGFVDPTDEFGLEHGQHWNEHYLAVCVVGWFETDRRVGGRLIPDRFTRPTPGQWESLIALVTDLRERYDISAEHVRGHRDLRGSRTVCPGDRLDLDALRSATEPPQAHL